MQQGKRRRKKSKFGYYLYAVVVLLLTITNITLAVLLLTHVQKIQINGTEISKEEDIRAWLTEDPMTVNSLYTVFKYKTGSYELPVYLEDVKVSLKLPWEVQVDVTEKDIIACLFYKNSYVYVDSDGLVMKTSPDYDGKVPYVGGIDIQKAEQFKVLTVKDKKVFTYIQDIIYEVRRNEISPDQIVWEDDSMNLYFGDVCVELGKMNYDVKIAELPPILETLNGKAGVLRMEHYSETGDSISFEAYVEEVQETEGEAVEETAETQE